MGKFAMIMLTHCFCSKHCGVDMGSGAKNIEWVVWRRSILEEWDTAVLYVGD